MTPRRLTPHRLAQQLGPAGPGVPAYRWLADGIRLLVADGRVLPDTTLPGERALTAQLGVSRTTVARAYADLVERGYAEARQGSGTRTRLPGPPAPAGEEPFGLQGRTLSGDAPPTVADLTATVPPAVPGLVAAFERAIAQLPRYLAGSGYHPAGLPVLREAVAEHYAARGVPTTPDQVIITSGAPPWSTSATACTPSSPRPCRAGRPRSPAVGSACGGACRSHDRPPWSRPLRGAECGWHRARRSALTAAAWRATCGRRSRSRWRRWSEPWPRSPRRGPRSPEAALHPAR